MDLAVLSSIAIYLMLITIYFLLYQYTCTVGQRRTHPEGPEELEGLAMVPVMHQEQGQIQEV